VTARRAAALLISCCVLRVVSLYRPCLSDDEAIYAVTGREMLTHHALYRDIVDHKPPAIYVLDALAEALGGMVVLHVLLILAVWSTGLLLARIVRGDAGWVAALLWCVFTTTLIDVDALAANCELWMMLPLVGAVVAFLEERLVLAGALVAIAMLFKYQAGIQLPLFAVTWIAHHRWRALPGLARLALGTAIPLAATVLAFVAAGTLASARFWFLFNFSYIDAGPPLGERLAHKGWQSRIMRKFADFAAQLRVGQRCEVDAKRVAHRPEGLVADGRCKLDDRHRRRHISFPQPCADEQHLVTLAGECGDERAHMHRSALVAEHRDATIGAVVENSHTAHASFGEEAGAAGSRIMRPACPVRCLRA